MLARMEIRRSPSAIAAFVVATLTALLLGVGLGYAVKPPTTHTVLVPEFQVTAANDSACEFINQHKAC